MTPSLESTNREISRLRDLPYGVARTAAFEQLVARIEAEGPDPARAYAYAGLVESLVWGQEVEKAFVPFTRWMRWADEHPEHLDDDDWHLLFWSFKWMVADLMDYPTVSRDQIERTLADMERRYALAGNGMNAVRHQHFLWAWAQDHPDTGAAYDAWVTTPRDDYSQCEACEPGDRAAYLFDVGRTEEGIRIVEAALEQDPTCATEPADMLARLQLGYLDAGRHAQAARTHRRALAALDAATGGMTGARARHVVFLARAGHPQEALARLRAEAHLLREAPTPFQRLGFLQQVAGVTRLLRTADPGAPADVPGVPAATIADLDDWVLREAQALGAQFDARDGSDGAARSLAAALALRVVDEPLDLAVIPRPADGTGPAAAPAVRPGTAPDAGGLPALADRAERARGAGDLADAAAAYLELAAAAREAGLLVDAGMAHAEAARCAQELHDERSAGWAYEEAVALLRAGGADPLVRAHVVRAWAPVAAEHERSPALLAELDALTADLTAAPADDEQASAERVLRARRAEAARLEDVRARTLATVGQVAAAIDVATAAAQELAGAGLPAEAADAFWLAGRLQRGEGRAQDAVWSLESAVEGFGIARDRARRAGAAGDLIALLRELGRGDQADELARDLG
ncbi:hypothetical protein [Cellulomonas gilvus]|uniref:Tetratricopeptide repeat protein n=1 Tax=Cellulomonas gilvus (strain ATCC 13127 / NRRL B-14078) TaxID=593907 RepID=F7ZZP0_CELGA|nr:hypothetical protein [Cellulomonas gilvus]AEI12533.1 hypothetical protein Celgi_2032 [Cellulomonas gilvus ATCC 13127]